MKFADGETPSVANATITAPESAYTELNSWFEDHGATDVRPLFESTDASPATSEARRHGLDRFFVAQVELSEREISGGLEALNALPYVEEAYVDIHPQPAVGGEPT